MQLNDIDFLWKELVADCPDTDKTLSAEVQVIQPQGYRHEIQTDRVRTEEGEAHVRFVFPLIDEGRYDPSHGTWNGAWEMGEYRFDLTLKDPRGNVLLTDSLAVDPHCFFPVDRMPIAVDARTQIIECAPRQLLYINRDEATFLIRIRCRRVQDCSVLVDVVDAGGETPLAGPWTYALTHEFQEKRFSTGQWPQGEYWIRIRVLHDGDPVGPWCVRKFWKQVSAEAPPPDVIELGGYPNVMVDDYTMERSENVQFLPDAMEKRPDAPLLEMTEEYEDESMKVETIDWNDRQQRYEGVYENRHTSLERRDTQHQRSRLKMLLISDDGERWGKPRLGLVTFDGECDNNILSNEPDELFEAKKARDIERARFTFYDRNRHGPVDLDRVFVASGKRHYFPFECKSLQGGDSGSLNRIEKGLVGDLRNDGLGVLPSPTDVAADPDAFSPRPGEFWPMEKRDDLYLVLTREPVLYLGVGMDLMHSSEIIHCHVERTGNRRLLWYFRPAAPAYPPHGVTYDNMHLCLRCLGVFWTDDGLTYHRQFVLENDEEDVIGSQFYCMGLLQEMGTAGDAPGRPVLDKIGRATIANQAFPTRSLYLGTALLHWGVEQTQAPELIWSRDLLHFHRFQAQRRSLIALGPDGSYDGGMVRDDYRYRSIGSEWWYPYIAVNTRHNGFMALNKFNSAEEMQEAFPNHADQPFFTTWPEYFKYGKQTRYLPALARCRPFRVAHAEPEGETGCFVTRKLRVDGNILTLNAETAGDGAVEIEILDENGNLLEPQVRTFRGNETDAVIADLSDRTGQIVRLKFTLHKAKVYAFSLRADGESR
jgi:hypothetical protein